MNEIVGVDFSGAKRDAHTWASYGRLSEDCLEIRAVGSITRAGLLAEMMSESAAELYAMDFPFGIPEDFARFIMNTDNAPQWVETCDFLAARGFREFMRLRDAFVEENGEPKRYCERRLPGSFSPLHKVNPNMLPMTYHGISLLASLDLKTVHMPPIINNFSGATGVLEVFPGATIRALGLNDKGYKDGSHALEMRHRIVQRLVSNEWLDIVIPEAVLGLCNASHDALDAVVACWTGALHIAGHEVFRIPSGHEIRKAAVEGWIYAPQFGSGAS